MRHILIRLILRIQTNLIVRCNTAMTKVTGALKQSILNVSSVQHCLLQIV